MFCFHATNLAIAYAIRRPEETQCIPGSTTVPSMPPHYALLHAGYDLSLLTPHRSFNVDKPNNTSIMVMIQKRTTTWFVDVEAAVRREE